MLIRLKVIRHKSPSIAIGRHRRSLVIQNHKHEFEKNAKTQSGEASCGPLFFFSFFLGFWAPHRLVIVALSCVSFLYFFFFCWPGLISCCSTLTCFAASTKKKKLKKTTTKSVKFRCSIF